MKIWFDGVGSAATMCATLYRLPQAAKIIRGKKNAGISRLAQGVFTLGFALWAAYGLLLNNSPTI
jgi:uncharacterized protein with PQ loop repeat